MKDVMLFNQCLDLMESQSLGKNEVTYAALLKVCNITEYIYLGAENFIKK